MPQSQLFSCELFSLSPRDWNCRSFRRTDQLDGRRVHFDIAGLQISIAHFSRSKSSLTANEHNRFLSERCSFFNLCRRSPLWIERNLHDPCAISKIEEDYSAEISAAMDPACKRDLLARMLSSERAREMGSKRGLGRRIGIQSAMSRRRGVNGLNLMMAYSWWKD